MIFASNYSPTESVLYHAVCLTHLSNASDGGWLSWENLLTLLRWLQCLLTPNVLYLCHESSWNMPHLTMKSLFVYTKSDAWAEKVEKLSQRIYQHIKK